VQVAPRPGIVPLRITLKVAPGERVVIAGGSEAETAAVVDSIFGLSLPSGGVIEVDGHDVRDLALRELRSRIALVRGAEIFPGCVFDNLRASNSDLTSEEAWEALDRVGLAEAVKALPEGLRAPISRDGAPLSRPQAIALTIARALAGTPSVLILDRTLDRIDTQTAVRIADRLLASRDSALLIVSEDPELQARMDRQVGISEPVTRKGEAA
jgi:ABC-type multidrug transport system fused ATPase/permease subunit